jgi:hypothetical protein
VDAISDRRKPEVSSTAQLHPGCHRTGKMPPEFLRGISAAGVRSTIDPGPFHPLVTDITVQLDGPIGERLTVAGDYFVGPKVANGTNVLGFKWSTETREGKASTQASFL